MRRESGWFVVVEEPGKPTMRRVRIRARTQLVGSDIDADIGVRRPGFPEFACGFRLEFGRPWFHRYAGRAESKGLPIDSIEVQAGDEVTLGGVKFCVERRGN